MDMGDWHLGQDDRIIDIVCLHLLRHGGEKGCHCGLERWVHDGWGCIGLGRDSEAVQMRG